MKRLLFLITVFSTLIACKNENQNSEKIDEDFQVFVEKFSRDSLFQISRVKFPLAVTELDNEYESVEKKVEKYNYRKIDLRYDNSCANRELSKYIEKIKLEKNKATIEIRGIENGIMTDFYFEKRDGKWRLIGWDDSST
jgi:hypothetical protein